FPKSVFSTFEEKLSGAITAARRWLAEALAQQASPQAEMELRRIAADISELYVLGTSLRFDTSSHHPDICTIRTFDRKIVLLLRVSVGGVEGGVGGRGVLGQVH